MFDTQGLLAQIANGATIFDASGEKIGTVAEVGTQGTYLLVQKGWLFHKDFYIPLSEVTRVDELGGVFLNVHKQDLDERYDHPPVPDKTVISADTPATDDDVTTVGVRAGVAGDVAAEDSTSDVQGPWLDSDKTRMPLDEDF